VERGAARDGVSATPSDIYFAIRDKTTVNTLNASEFVRMNISRCCFGQAAIN